MSALPRQTPDRNDSGADVTARIPAADAVPGVHALRPQDVEVWDLAAPYLKNRDNDVHTLYSYGLARALCDLLPEADQDVVLPAILLHDTGWSTVPLPEIMAALTPGARSGAESKAIVRRHEVEGARIAEEILQATRHPQDRIATIVRIVEGHDTRAEAESLEDAIVKDADKLWRVTPHGVDTVMDWFGLGRDASHRLNAVRTHDHLFTEPARTMARALSAVGWVDASPQRVALG